MPLYEYECSSCHRITEAVQKFSDGPLTECPNCHGRLHKLISLSSFHLKGTGWYVTDYAGKKAGSQTGNGKSETGAEDDKAGKAKKDDSANTSD